MAGSEVRTHYQVLGVPRTAGAAEIRRAHRQLAQLLHPDRQGAASGAEQVLAERRMREVNAAWTVLSDPTRRAVYDRSLAVAGSRSAAGRPTAAPRPASRPAAATGSRPEDGDDPDAALARARLAELDPDEPDLSAGHFWLLRRVPVLLALVVGVVLFIATAYAGGRNETPGKVSGLADGPTNCIRLVEGRNAIAADCAQPNDGEVVTRVAQVLDCPDGTKYALLNNEFVCVREGGP